jgi:CubicO group peptidase (beta-lactamase class C family)
VTDAGLEGIERLFRVAVERHAFPAAVIEVGRVNGVLWRDAFGRLTYAEDAEPATIATIFDLASLTKVIATAPLAMRAIDAGRLRLDDRVAEWLPSWRGSDRDAVTIADLLEHASGLTAYLPFFRDHDGRDEFERAICTMPLEYAPRTQSIYSDLGFMLLGFILEDLNGTALARQFDQFVDDAGIGAVAFHDSRAGGTRFDKARCAPTELDLWRGRLLQGEVHDENAWALGGAAGHAGLFGTVEAVGAFARAVLRGLLGGESFATAEALQRFTRPGAVPGSSRALAWDTMRPTSSCGSRLSPRAIGHTGFTGTSLWIDPANDLYIALLTNRVHPTRENNQIQGFRRRLHDAIGDHWRTGAG